MYEYVLKISGKKANLIATSEMKQEMITIKIPPTTAESRKKLVKTVESIEKEFDEKCKKFVRAQYDQAMAAAPDSENYSEEMCHVTSARALAAHIKLTLEHLTDQKRVELEKIVNLKTAELLGKDTKKSKKKK